MSKVFYIKKASERLAKPVIKPVLCIGLFLLGNGCSGSSNQLGMGMGALRSTYSTSSKLFKQGVTLLSGAIEKESHTHLGSAAGKTGVAGGFVMGGFCGGPLAMSAVPGVASFLLPSSTTILGNGARYMAMQHLTGLAYPVGVMCGGVLGGAAVGLTALSLVAGTRTLSNYGIDQYNLYAARHAAIADWAAYIKKNSHQL